MENQTKILVVGTHPGIMETVLRLLNKNELWDAAGVGTPHEVMEQVKVNDYRIVLIGAGLTDEEEMRLNTDIRLIRPSIHIIPHYGGGSGLLYAEIYLALGIKNQAQ